MERPMRIRMVIAFLIVFVSTIPNLGFELNTLGFHWNAYRLVAVFLSLIVLFVDQGSVKLSGRTEAVKWMALFLIWLIYGAVLFVLSPYKDSSRGFRELLGIFLALITFYILTGLHLSDREIERVLRLIFWLAAGLAVFGIVEHLTSWHLPTSMFSDPTNRDIRKLSQSMITGIMYNVNDFSALLTLMCTTAIGRYRINFRRGYFDPGWILIAVVAVINHINDANTCNFAILLGAGLYILLRESRDRRILGRILFWGTVIIAIAAVLLFIFGGDIFLTRSITIVNDSVEGYGSLHSRMLIYYDSIKVALETGFLGLGPGGFPVYFTQNPGSTKYVNPHGLLPEILSEYGLIITVLFVWLLIRLIRKMFRIYRQETDTKRKEWGRMGVIAVFVYLLTSFAPSSYLLNTFHWAFLALLVLITEHVKETEKGKENNTRQRDQEEKLRNKM